MSGQYPLEEGPLSQMSEAVASLEGPHTPCTPHTPGLPATPNTPGTGHKSPRSGMTSERNNKDFTNDIKTDFNLEDLNFDPAAIIGDNNGDWNVSEVYPANLTIRPSNFVLCSSTTWILTTSYHFLTAPVSWRRLPPLEQVSLTDSQAVRTGED